MNDAVPTRPAAPLRASDPDGLDFPPPAEASRPDDASDPRDPSVNDVFPANVAVLFLVHGFVLTRMFVGFSAERPWAANLGSFLSVAGVILAWVAFGRALVSRARGALPFVVAGLRGLVALPMLALTLTAMRGDLPPLLQLTAAVSAALTVLVAGGVGIASSLQAGHRLAPLTLGLLVVGEWVELIAPPLRLFYGSGRAILPRWADGLGTVGEVCTFAGALCAAVWTLRAAARDAGWTRTLTFAAMPASVGVALLMLPVKFPRTTESAAKHAFRARFDLVGGAVVAHPSRLTVALYTLPFTLLLVASMVSLAGQYHDRGSAVRRSLGWLCILMAGFGGHTAAGLIDPFRLVCLSLGMVLLEGAAARETAPT